MTTKYIDRCGLLLAGFLVLASCKKDRVSSNDVTILQPTIEKLSRPYVQSGEKLTLYGKNLSQGTLLTEVTIDGRPAELLVRSADSLQVLVPSKLVTGKVVVTVSTGQTFRTAVGPEIEIKPTPLIKRFWPAYAYGGDTVALIVENFSALGSDNSITLNGRPLDVAGGNGRDTILIKLPEDALTGALHWSTFHGPDQQMNIAFPVRQTSYRVTTAGAWLQLDPAFSYTDTLFRGYPVLGGPNYEEYLSHIYLAAMEYVNSADHIYTIFVTADHYYIDKGITFNKFVDDIKNKPHLYNGPIASTVVPDIQLSLDDMKDGNEYNTLYNQQLIFDGDPTQAVRMLVTERDGMKYVNLLGIYGETNPPVKILREHKIGNATIIEIDGETGFIPF